MRKIPFLFGLKLLYFSTKFFFENVLLHKVWANLVQHFFETLLANHKIYFSSMSYFRYSGDSDDVDDRAGDGDDGHGDAGTDDGKHRQQRCTRHLGTGSS
jgi:hypothetical protein